MKIHGIALNKKEVGEVINLYEIKVKLKSEEKLDDKVVISAIKDVLKCYELDVEVIKEEEE